MGSMVTILPLHNPIIAAKSIATLDWFSGGRAQVTVGVRRLEEEYDAVGVPVAKRGRIADENLAAKFELWHSSIPSFEGEFVSFDEVTFGPKPVSRSHPVVWMGGDADAVLRRAARYRDSRAPWLTKPDALLANTDHLRTQAGFDSRPFSLFYSLAVRSIGQEHAVMDDPNTQFGQSAQQVIDNCCKLAEFGVTDTWVNPPTSSTPTSTTCSRSPKTCYPMWIDLSTTGTVAEPLGVPVDGHGILTAGPCIADCSDFTSQSEPTSQPRQGNRRRHDNCPP
ncbi:LLM class flavin-dependent oxidoreductase [Mycobacterium sp. HUMS_1102779]